MKIENNIGPMCDPWGTPDDTATKSDLINLIQSIEEGCLAHRCSEVLPKGLNFIEGF